MFLDGFIFESHEIFCVKVNHINFNFNGFKEKIHLASAKTSCVQVRTGVFKFIDCYTTTTHSAARWAAPLSVLNQFPRVLFTLTFLLVSEFALATSGIASSSSSPPPVMSFSQKQSDKVSPRSSSNGEAFDHLQDLQVSSLARWYLFMGL